MRLSNVQDLEKQRQEANKAKAGIKKTILVCAGTGCLASGAAEVAEAFRKEIKDRGIDMKVELTVKTTGCHGFCERGPIVTFLPSGILYQHVSPEEVQEIVEKTVISGKIIKELLYRDPKTKKYIEQYSEIPFYALQTRIVLQNSGQIDPASIDDYLTVGGFSALAKSLSMQPEQIIQEVENSGLKGRGGAGFPTGLKWKALANQPNGRGKFLVCNGDEGDPGAYMDRSVLEGIPHSVIEGMLIGAYATGATEGIIYVRNEYPLAVKHLNIALQQARELGLLGENILGTGFSFDINLVKGAGAFVCGEETALIRSIEGKIPEPRQRPPFPVQKGINAKPTVINNVETWANIPIIIEGGAKAFAKIGTKNNSGTKIFSLVGKIRNTGLVEVPMGITIKEIVDDIGGGPVGKAKIKAVQTGGPSGGCIPAERFDLPIDYDSLTEAGSIMGSGGMIVMDENTCMVDIAKYFMNFLKDESCGKCFTCRKGTQRMYEILDDISKGKGTLEQLDLLEQLAHVVKDTTMCGLGQTAPNPVLSTLRYFHNEYIQHIEKKHCQAGVCKELITYSINENCTGCQACVKVCTQDAITGQKKQRHVIDTTKCIKCGACRSACKFEAIEVV